MQLRYKRSSTGFWGFAFLFWAEKVLKRLNVFQQDRFPTPFSRSLRKKDEPLSYFRIRVTLSMACGALQVLMPVISLSQSNDDEAEAGGAAKSMNWGWWKGPAGCLAGCLEFAVYFANLGQFLVKTPRSWLFVGVDDLNPLRKSHHWNH